VSVPVRGAGDTREAGASAPRAGGEGAPPEPLLSVRHLCKSFGSVRAVEDVSLDIYPREIVGIVGDNAAGKSTFLALLTGYHHADSGEILYRGHPVRITSPRTSRGRLKIEMIYQNLSLAPDLRVWENAFLGEERRRFGIFLDPKAMQDATDDALRKLNAQVRAMEVFGNLSGGEQQAVAISRALLFERDIIIMDEPTASISLNKVHEVLQLIKTLKEHGKTVLVVSHRLEDILQVSDRIVIFSHGKIQQIVRNEGLHVEDLFRMIFRGG
jgi:ABC-type sugar transport system ATPase subunit